MYSFGCLLTALVAGRPPFTAELPVAVLHHHAYIQPPRLRSLRPDVPEELDALVGDLLDKDPAARPTATEAHERLARIAGALTPAATVPSAWAGVAAAVSPPTAASPVAPAPTGESAVLPAPTGESTAMHAATAAHDEAATATLDGVSTATFSGASRPGRHAAHGIPTPEDALVLGAPTPEEPAAPAPVRVRPRASSVPSGKRRRRVMIGAAAAVAAGIVAFSATEGESRAPEPVAKVLVTAEKVLVADAAVTAEPVATAVASPAPTEAPTAAVPSTAVAPVTQVEDATESPAQEPAVTGKGQDNSLAGENNGRTGKGQNSNNGKGK